MQANPRKLLDLFGGTLRYVVPIFQRHYVWEQGTQWEPLREDILEKVLKRLSKQNTMPHFLGALILNSARKKSTKEVSRFIVIDGQQRLVTVQIILAALRDVAFTKNLTEIGTAVARYILNPDPELMENSDEEIYKLWPTQFNREVFCSVINAGSKEKVRKLFPLIRKKYKRHYELRDRLVNAYEFFSESIETFIANQEGDYEAEDVLLEIFGVLKDDFKVVEIILDENDNSQEIFHSLNSQGKPLSQSDLLRSFIFMRAENSEEDRDYLYNKYWQFFEKTFWDEQIRRGNQWVSHLDALTRVFLSSKKGETIDTKRVHLEYKDWINDKKPYTRVEDELEDFHRYGKTYHLLLNPVGDDDFYYFASRLKIWDVSTIYPLIIYLREEARLTTDELKECFVDLESFLVRRLICEMTTKEYNKFFVEIIRRLREKGELPLTLRQILLEGKGDTRVWPDDSKFVKGWLDNGIYNNLKSNQIVTLLKLIEERLRSTKTESITIHQASVEHIMPREWATNYMLDGVQIEPDMARDWFYSLDADKKKQREIIEDKVKRRNHMIHTIGNLTIVTQPLNSALRNAPFDAKKAELRHSSILMLNQYFDGLSEWNEDSIYERAKALSEHAVNLWPHPGNR
jgi:uncharacterized protein with ParB-like and HNH nuclease domain